MGILSGSAAMLEDAPLDPPKDYTGFGDSQKQLEILGTERSDQLRRYGKVDPALEAEIENAKNPGKRSKPVISAAPPAESASLLRDSISELDDGGPVRAPITMPKPSTLREEGWKGWIEGKAAQLPDIPSGMPGGGTAAEVAANQLTGLGTSIVGGFRGMATLAMGGTLDDAVKAVHGEDAGAIARTTQPTSPGGQAISTAMASPANPMNWMGVAAHKAGEVTADVTGSPGAGATVETGLTAPQFLLLRGGKPTGAPRLVGGSSIAEQPKAITAPTTNYDVPTYLRQKEKAPVGPPAAQEVPNAPVKESGVQPIEAVKFAEESPVADVGKKLPKEEQARRAQVLADIGITDIRKSAVEGDVAAMKDQAQNAKLNSPAGQAELAKLTAEREALRAHAEQIVTDTGGTTGMDESTRMARGNTILSPLDGLKQWFTDQTKALYNEARAKGQGQGVTLSGLDEQLGKKSNFTGSSDTLQLREGIKDRMGELGMLDKEGKLLPSTVDQVENLRKYINERWTPNSNHIIRTLKNTLDEDVTKAAGTDTFAKARKLHQMKMATLDDPKGIAKIMDSEGPINRAVATEKIADTIAGLPAEQLAHIVKTLQTVPAELQPQAATALAEIKAHFANKIRDIGDAHQGQWNSRGVTDYLKKNSHRLAQVFKPEELAKINTLNEAGQILKIDASYPGAAAQWHNLARSGLIEKGAQATGAGVGAVLGGLVGMPAAGAAAGGLAASAALGRFSEGNALAKVRKGYVPLSEIGK